MKSDEIKITAGPLWIEDGIMRHFIEVEEHTVEMAEEQLEHNKRLGKKIKGKKLMLVNFGNLVKQTPESRRVFGRNEALKEVMDKAALVVKNPVAKVIANFFMGINKPVVPTKMFTSEAEAIKWLKEE